MLHRFVLGFWIIVEDADNSTDNQWNVFGQIIGDKKLQRWTQFSGQEDDIYVLMVLKVEETLCKKEKVSESLVAISSSVSLKTMSKEHKT